MRGRAGFSPQASSFTHMFEKVAAALPVRDTVNKAAGDKASLQVNTVNSTLWSNEIR